MDDFLNFKTHAEHVSDKISGSLKCLYKLCRSFNFYLRLSITLLLCQLSYMDLEYGRSGERFTIHSQLQSKN